MSEPPHVRAHLLDELLARVLGAERRALLLDLQLALALL